MSIEENKSSPEKIVNIDDNPMFQVEGSKMLIPLKRDNFPTIGHYKKFINSVERQVRSSPEYKDWISYLRGELGATECSLTHEVNDETSVEIHHHPISLFNVCSIICNTLMTKGEFFSTFDVAQFVIALHFQGKVGFIPLVKSIHEKFHNGFLDIPIDLVKGDWRFLVDNFVCPPEVQVVVNKFASIGLANASTVWTNSNYQSEDNDDSNK
jgi:hypothetical protein